MTSIIEFCRTLRRQQTAAETILWQQLRNRNLLNKKFLRQHPICALSVFGRNLFYIPDFYCHEAKLVIEADGPVHLSKKLYDQHRDEVLNTLDLKILRFTNKEIETDLYNVLKVIMENL